MRTCTIRCRTAAASLRIRSSSWSPSKCRKGAARSHQSDQFDQLTSNLQPGGAGEMCGQGPALKENSEASSVCHARHISSAWSNCSQTPDIGILVALKSWPELGVHVRGAVNNGLTELEIREALLQATVYCGAPAGMEAFKVAEATLNNMVEKGEHSRTLASLSPDAKLS